MDQLSKDACAATKAGLTYGKYMARRKVLAEKKTAEEEGRRRKCVLCGRPVPPGRGRRLYCSAECAEKYREQQARERRETNAKGQG